MGVAGLVLGIIGVILSFFPVINWICIVMGVIGLILSIVAVATSKQRGESNGMAVAGIVLCSITLAFSVIMTFACAACVSMLPF